MRKFLFAGGLVLLLVGVLAATGLFRIYQLLGQPFGPSTPHVAQIPLGISTARIGVLLSEVGLLRSPYLLRVGLEVYPSERALQAGRYAISPPLSPLDLLALLRQGQTQRQRLTLREGLDWQETVSHLVARRLGSRRRFNELVTSPQLIQDIDSQADDLEGYLFPETYFLEVTAGEQEITQILLGQARQVWTSQRRRQASDLNMTVREVLTLASLIEKETGQPEERPLVSSVFHNRLQRNMPLACDPTVIYAVKRVKEYDGILHRSDLEIDSPYNTYLYPGLPPGPIANPGLAAIEAALAPAQTDYLFFVSKNDGTHAFSRTYQEHSRAVRTYQR